MDLDLDLDSKYQYVGGALLLLIAGFGISTTLSAVNLEDGAGTGIDGCSYSEGTYLEANDCTPYSDGTADIHNTDKYIFPFEASNYGVELDYQEISDTQSYYAIWVENFIEQRTDIGALRVENQCESEEHQNEVGAVEICGSKEEMQEVKKSFPNMYSEEIDQEDLDSGIESGVYVDDIWRLHEPLTQRSSCSVDMKVENDDTEERQSVNVQGTVVISSSDLGTNQIACQIPVESSWDDIVRDTVSVDFQFTKDMSPVESEVTKWVDGSGSGCVEKSFKESNVPENSFNSEQACNDFYTQDEESSTDNSTDTSNPNSGTGDDETQVKEPNILIRFVDWMVGLIPGGN
jgi:hypothetical protein